MKLRNKKTGEIKEVIVGGYPVSGKTKMWECSEIDANEETGYKSLGTYTSLSELNEEWEDVSEEPKEFWFIEPNGVVARIDEWDCCTDSDIEIMKTLGNYFETKEEADKAVEKLKAWKRLKDKGFRFTGVAGLSNDISFKTDNKYICAHIIYDEYTADKTVKEYIDDLMLLFGGEE